MTSAPSGCRPTGTTGAPVPSGRTTPVGTNTAGCAGRSLPTAALGTTDGTAPGGVPPGGAVVVPPAGTTGAGTTGRPRSPPWDDAGGVVRPGPNPTAATAPVAASATP